MGRRTVMLGYRVLWLVLIAGIWQVIAMFRVVDPSLMPSLDAVLRYLLNAIWTGDIIEATVFSLILIAKGMLIGLSVALTVSAIAMVNPVFASFLGTVTALAHPLPGVALLPLIIVWLGTGTESIILIIVHSVIWPAILNATAGFRSIPRIYREVGQNFGLSQAAIIGRIFIPASLPHLLAGLKIGWARAWRALISAEMIFGAAGGHGGLGWYIFEKRVFMDTTGIYAGIVVIVIIGMLVEDTVFRRLEMKMMALG